MDNSACTLFPRQYWALLILPVLFFYYPNVSADDYKFKPGQTWEFKDSTNDPGSLLILDSKTIKGKKVYFYRTGNNITSYYLDAVSEDTLSKAATRLISQTDVRKVIYWDKYQEDLKTLENKFIGACNANPSGCARFDQSIYYYPSKMFFSYPKSRWLESRKKLYGDYFKKNKFDLLIIPIQVVSYRGTIDKDGRAMITRKITALINDNTRLKAPNPDYLYSYYGKNVRDIDEGEITNLAALMKVKKILVGYVCFNGPSPEYSSIMFQLYERDPGSSSNYTVKSQLLLDKVATDEVTPVFKSFDQYSDKLLKFIGAHRIKKKKTVVHTNEKIDLPKSFAEVIRRAGTGPYRASVYLQFLASVHPSSEFFQNLALMGPAPSASMPIVDNALYERSLLLLDKLPADDPNQKYLRARALYYLGRRPAAVKVLRNARTPQEKALLEFLNGNTDRMYNNIQNIKSPIFRYFSAIELHKLNFFYTEDKKYEIIDDINFDNTDFKDLFQSKFHYDPWKRLSFESINRALDKQFPIEKFNTDNLIKLNVANGNLFITDLQYIGYINDHLTIAEKDLLKENKVNHPEALVTKQDVLDLLKAVFYSAIVNEARFYVKIQNDINSAVSFIDSVENIMPDNPELEFSRSNIYYKLATGNEQGVKRDNDIYKAFDSALKYIKWSGGKSVNVVHAMNTVKDILRNHADTVSRFSNIHRYVPQELHPVYLNDFPKSETWGNANPTIGGASPLDYTIYDITLLHDSARKYSGNKELVTKLLQDNKDRFYGNPGRAEVYAYINSLISGKPENKKPVDYVENYKKLIAKGNTNEDVYYMVAQKYIQDNDYKKAYDLLSSYPTIKDPSAAKDKLVLENKAFMFGDLFYAMGETDYAKEFFDISSRYDTGGGSEYRSRALNDLMQSDFTGAADQLLTEAKRYNNEWAYSRYLSILFSMKQNEAAWLLLDDLVDKFKYKRLADINLLKSAIVGHRIEANDNQTVKNWILKRVSDKNSANSFSTFAARYFLTDRGVVDDLPDTLEKIMDKGRGVTNDIQTRVARLYFKGYMQAREHKFRDAYATFSKITKNGEYAPLLEHIISSDSFVIPYYYYSGVKTGNQKQLVKSGFSDTELNIEPLYRVDDYVLKAFKSSLAGDQKTAVTNLINAFNVMPGARDRKINIWYQLAEAAEFLYLETGDAQFKQLLLKWVKKEQIISPMYGWAYAFEALYTDDENRREQALAYALYLDRNSYRLRKFSKKQKNEAMQWLSHHNKFLMLKQPVKEKQMKV